MSQPQSPHQRRGSSSSLSDAPSDPAAPEARTKKVDKRSSVSQLPSAGIVAVPKSWRAHLPWNKGASRAPTRSNSPVKKAPTAAAPSQEAVPAQSKEATPAPVVVNRPIAPKPSITSSVPSGPAPVVAKPRSTAASKPGKKLEWKPISIASGPSAFDNPAPYKPLPKELPPPHLRSNIVNPEYYGGTYTPWHSRRSENPVAHASTEKNMATGHFEGSGKGKPAANTTRTNTEQKKTEAPVKSSTKGIGTASEDTTYITAFKKGVEVGSKLREVGDAEVYAEMEYCKDALRSLIKAGCEHTEASLDRMAKILSLVHSEIGPAGINDKSLFDGVVGEVKKQKPPADTVVAGPKEQQAAAGTVDVEHRDQQAAAETVVVEPKDQQPAAEDRMEE